MNESQLKFRCRGWVSLTILPVLLAGCVSQSDAPPAGSANAVPVVDAPKTQAQIAEPVVRPFPEGSLYALLSAEVAGYRGDYQFALDTYLVEARKTGDPGVAARVTRLAAYMKADEAVLEGSELWVGADETSLEARQFLADQLVKRGRYVDALVQMQAIDRLGGEAQFDFFAYRASRMATEDQKALLAGLEGMLLENPLEPQVLFSQAALLEALGRIEDALVVSDSLLTLKPEELNFIILKANLLGQLNRKAEGRTVLRAALLKNPKEARLRLLLARSLLEDQLLDEARLAYQALYEERPEDGEVLFAMAVLSIEAEDFEQARLHLLRLVRTGQRESQAQYYLGLVAEQAGDAALALREFGKVKGGYEFLSAQGRIADLLRSTQSMTEARAYLSSKKEIHQGLRPQLDLIEGQLLSRFGDQGALFEHLDRAVAAAPKDLSLLYFRAMSGQKFDRLDILERDLRQILKLDPENADAMNALGYTLADQTDRFDEALMLISEALRLKPDEPAFIDSMGWVLYRLERFDEALIYLERALDLFPNDEVAAHLGEVLWASGKTRQAKRVWNASLVDYPESQYLKAVLKRFLDR
ncbi:MAG: tetratricopeptide repeat protein [Pseudomonadales bacterium]